MIEPQIKKSTIREELPQNTFQSLLINPIHQKTNQTIIEEKQKILNSLYAEIKAEINKVVVCQICRRKFSNQSHYIRHCTFSELHKANIEKKKQSNN